MTPTLNKQDKQWKETYSGREASNLATQAECSTPAPLQGAAGQPRARAGEGARCSAPKAQALPHRPLGRACSNAAAEPLRGAGRACLAAPARPSRRPPRSAYGAARQWGAGVGG
jgi:hypothetical protein